MIMTRFMIAGTHSGCGKTTVTCAILQALKNRGLDVASFKCGPDYIDPMFHSRVIGTAAYNLDGFFCGKDTLNFLLYQNGRDVSVMEGVMGFFDGVGQTASSHQLALDTETPVVLVIDCKGMSASIGAVMKGFLTYRTPHNIAGVIFNRLPESLVDMAKAFCTEMQVTYFGRFPTAKECTVESRHLGLVTADEIQGLKETIQRLAALAEEHLLIDELLQTGKCAEISTFTPPVIPYRSTICPKIAVARDKAFCFYYEDNLNLLREMGCEILPFSPLTDRAFPDGVSGLLLGGGYPELYAKELAANESMRSDIRAAIAACLPTIAECGGFLYLHQTLETPDGEIYPMVGAIDGHGFCTEKLRRFGYVYLTAEDDNLLCERGEIIPAHEFHYWDSDSCGDGFTARKASNGLTYPCVHARESLYAGFPHLYFYANPKIAEHFVRKCEAYTPI